ncbi:hypothetical protein L0F81_42800, partial [Streptomyces tricolor]|nr:hypothetical protein [Streptomyces tricolor]
MTDEVRDFERPARSRYRCPHREAVRMSRDHDLPEAPSRRLMLKGAALAAGALAATPGHAHA